MSIHGVVEDIRKNLCFLFEQQNATMPDISEMVQELIQTHIHSNDFLDCDEKKRFINKYYSIFSVRHNSF